MIDGLVLQAIIAKLRLNPNYKIIDCNWYWADGTIAFITDQNDQVVGNIALRNENIAITFYNTGSTLVIPLADPNLITTIEQYAQHNSYAIDRITFEALQDLLLDLLMR